MPKRKCFDVDELLPQNLVFFRKRAGLTQQQVADKLNLNRTTYTKYETGASEPGIEMLKNLAKILHVEVGALLADDSGLEAADASEDWQHDDDMHRRYSRLSEDKKAIIDQMLLEMTEEN